MKRQAGQTLLEVLIALGVSVVIVTTLTTAVITGLNNSQSSKNDNLATHYAQEGLEFMRKLRDSDWTTFFSYYSGSLSVYYKCLAKTADNMNQITSYPCSLNINNFFTRQITITKNATECTPANPPPPTPTPIPTRNALITVDVSWFDSKCKAGEADCHKVTVSSCLSDYGVIATPGTNDSPTPTPTP